MKEATENPDERVLISCVICSVGHRSQTKEQASLVRDLWNVGVRATVLDHCQVVYLLHFSFIFHGLNMFFSQSLEEVVTWCRERNVPHICLLKDSEAGSARLKTWEKDR